MKIPKILVVAQDIHPRRGSEAGKAYLFVNSISNKYKVKVFTELRNKDAIEKDKISKNIEVDYVNLDGVIEKIVRKYKLYNIRNRLFISKVEDILKQGNAISDYDLIHVLTPSGIHCYNELYKLGIPVLIGPIGGALSIPNEILADMDFKVRLKERIRMFIYYSIMKWPKWKKYFENAELILVGTDYLKKYMPERSRKRCMVFFDTAVDTNEFKDAHRGDRKYVTFVGRLEPQKGCKLVIDAFIRVAKAYKDQKFIIIGGGSLQNYIMKKINRSGMRNQITMTGNIPRKSVKKYLTETKIYCLPSLREPGGVSVLEAMACECPVIVSDYGGLKYSVNDKCGIKITIGKYNDMLNAIEKSIRYLLENPNIAKKMGEYGRGNVKNNFSKKQLMLRMDKIYNTIIEQNMVT